MCAGQCPTSLASQEGSTRPAPAPAAHSGLPALAKPKAPTSVRACAPHPALGAAGEQPPAVSCATGPPTDISSCNHTQFTRDDSLKPIMSICIMYLQRGDYSQPPVTCSSCSSIQGEATTSWQDPGTPGCPAPLQTFSSATIASGLPQTKMNSSMV